MKWSFINFRSFGIWLCVISSAVTEKTLFSWVCGIFFQFLIYMWKITLTKVFAATSVLSSLMKNMNNQFFTIHKQPLLYVYNGCKNITGGRRAGRQIKRRMTQRAVLECKWTLDRLKINLFRSEWRQNGKKAVLELNILVKINEWVKVK